MQTVMCVCPGTHVTSGAKNDEIFWRGKNNYQIPDALLANPIHLIVQ